VKHDTIDLINDAKGMAKQLQGVEAEYLFFAAYLQKETEQEMWDINGEHSFLRPSTTVRGRPSNVIAYCRCYAQELS